MHTVAGLYPARGCTLYTRGLTTSKKLLLKEPLNLKSRGRSSNKALEKRELVKKLKLAYN